MKKQVLIAAVLLLSMASCKKEVTTDVGANVDSTSVDASTVKSIVLDSTKTDSVTATEASNEVKQTMKDEAGKTVEVTFNNQEKDGKRTGTITIVREGKATLVLDKTSAWAKGAEYERGDVSAHSQGDVITVTEAGKKYVIKK